MMLPVLQLSLALLLVELGLSRTLFSLLPVMAVNSKTLEKTKTYIPMALHGIACESNALP